MNLRVLAILLFLLSLITAACESKATSTPASSPTLSPTAPENVSPTAGETPTPSQPSPTVTPNPTQTEPIALFSYEPDPIPVTPSSPANAYRLKNWTEEAWLASINEARIFTTKLSENWASIDSVYTFYDLTKHLIMMEREALLRYPNMADYNDVAWDLAYRESISVNFIDHYSVELLASLLEEGLNSGEFALESLISELSHRNFAVVEFFESDNLFGAGHSGLVLHIESYDPRFASESIAALVAIGGSDPGDFHVIPVKQLWDWNYHSSKTVSVSDRNKNGVDEVLLINDYWGSGAPGGCGSNLSLYEWQGDYPNGRFENVAANVADIFMSFASGDCERPWEFEDENANDVPIIKAYRRIYITVFWEECPRYEEWTLYTWNGQAYEWTGEGVNPIEDPPKCSIGWANIAGGLNDDAVEIVEAALLDWPLAMNETWGPASEDYFRFKLGTWYALRGETELAIETLESVRDYPNNPDFSKASELATLYLTNYERQGVNVACEAVRDHILEIAPHPVCCGLDIDTMLKTWGFANPQWTYFIRDICEQEPSASQTENTAPSETESWSLAKQELAITQIEQTLFEAGDSVQAKLELFDLLEADLIGTGNEGKLRSYLLYLLGLTYELSGDETSAVGLYWQIWHKYPESPYALIIRHKLELIE